MEEATPVAAEAAPTPVTIVETPAPSMEDTMAAIWDKNNPPRENGKFVAKEPKEAAPAEVESAPEQVSTDQQPEKVEVEPAQPLLGLPAQWSPDKEAFWKTLPPDEQKFLSDREAGFRKQLSELGETAKTAKSYGALTDKYRHVLKGNDPVQEFESLLNTKHQLLSNPAGSIQWLAQQLGVDLSQLVQGAQQSADPVAQLVQQQTAPLQRQLVELTNQIQSQRQQELDARGKALSDQIAKFSEGKDYWPEIEDETISQILAMRARDEDKVIGDPMAALKEAHDRAIKLTPAVQEKLNAAAKKEADKKAAEEAKKKADEAKRHAQLNVKSVAGKSPTANGKGMWDTDAWSQAYDKAQGA